MKEQDKKAYEQRIIALEKQVRRLQSAIKKERYGLVWMDVPEGFDDDVENKLPILVEVPEKGILNNDGKPTHILIEGDNYHALTCLNYSHKEKIDLIYIDPPYNTGTDGFKFKDKRYLDKFPDGTDVPKDHPLRHSYWLSFMKKRLELARSLLKETGVMFISIDDNECAQLKMLCTSIFLKESNVEMYIWDVKDESEGAMPKTAKNTVRKEHEYLIACFKDKTKVKFNRYMEFSYLENEDWSNPDNDPRGEWMSGNISRGEGGKPGKNYFTIITPTGIKYTRNWAIPEDDYKSLREDKRIFFAKKGNGVPRIKIFKNEERPVIQSSIFSGLKSSIAGTNTIVDILGKCDFDHPKPVELVKRITEVASRENSIILDFFAGTGTTGHSVLDLNAKKGKRQFILITNNENNICEDITYPRVKAVINGYTSKGGEKISCLGGSLKYFKTDFVAENNIINVTDKDKVQIAYHAGELLALAENTLYKLEFSSYYQIFADFDDLSKVKRYTAVYFREELSMFEEFSSKVFALKKPVVVYIFSWGEGEFDNIFENSNVIKVKPIPQPILEIYKSIYNL